MFFRNMGQLGLGAAVGGLVLKNLSQLATQSTSMQD